MDKFTLKDGSVALVLDLKLGWSKQKKTGLIETACTLNLLSGGFEMKRLGIPAQCVMLDYSGCRKHWDKEGISTDINLDQIKRVLERRTCKAV